MKLSLTRRPRWTHVQAGRVMIVKRTHAVSAKGLSTAKEETVRTFDRELVFAAPGDLAMEMVLVKDRSLVGHSYLSGDAMQLNGYDADPEWFEEGSSFCVDVPHPGADQDEFFERLVGAMRTALSEADLAAFHIRVQRGVKMDEMKHMCAVLQHAGDVAKTRGCAHRSLLVGIVGEKPHIDLAWQPPKQASDWSLTRFQFALVVDGICGGKTP
jgi:hypothetical protein